MLESIKAFFSEALSISPLSWIGITTVVCCSGVIGFERQWSGKPAGIRTSILICLGVYVFIAVSSSVINVNGDHTRVIGQVVTGIGFLGAGVILTKNGIVLGVTSAAAIWLLAAVGTLIGVGHVKQAIWITLISTFLLISISWIERRTKYLRKGVHKNDPELD